MTATTPAVLRAVLENFAVGTLWMHKPWEHDAEIIDRFPTRESLPYLKAHLRGLYPNLAALEDIANARKIPMVEPWMGARIGAFTVLAPSRAHFQELLITSARTPEHTEGILAAAAGYARGLAEEVKKLVAAAWGDEYFPPDGTSNENEMSIVQYANLSGKRILLTADAGRATLTEAADYSGAIGGLLQMAFYFGALIVQYLAVRWAATNAGRRFVTNAMACHQTAASNKGSKGKA